MINVVIFGGPGSGKGTQSALIKEYYNLTHLSTGDLLREEIAKKSEIGNIADSYISKGNLAPDSLIIDLLEKHIQLKLKDSKGFIFDGFPRTVVQAQELEKMLAKHNTQIDVMVDLVVEEQELINRLLNRGKTSGRSDDNLEVIQKRLDVYKNQTAPVIEFYKEKGKYRGIADCTTVDDYFNKIKEIIG